MVETTQTAVRELQASVVTNTAGLASLESEWRELDAACPAATVFQTFEWNAAWWRHFGTLPGRKLRLLAFRDDADKLVGLAPLMTSFWYATPLRRLSLVGMGASDYLDALALPGWEDQIVDAIYGHLVETGGWQIADFQQLREGGLLRTRAPRAADSLICLDALQEPCPFRALPPDWETLAQGLGKKTRANIGYYDRALHKTYAVEARAVSEEDALDGEMARLFALHGRRWNQRLLPGVFSNGRTQRFHCAAARALLRRDWLRLFCLKLDGKTQAVLYCFAYGDRWCYYQGGWEPELAKLSLGTVLTARAMQAAISEGRQVFDFLRGDEPYKAKWTTTAQTNLRRLITRRETPFSALAARAHQVESDIERRAKAWMRGKH